MTNEQLQPYQYLANVLPEVLSEGPVLVEFKSPEKSDIISSIIVTLHADECSLDSKPSERETEGETLWAWCINREEWVLLDLKEVENAQIWPPSFEENAAFDAAHANEQ